MAAQWLRSGTLPDLTVPNLPVDGAPAPTFFGAYGQWMVTPPPSWDDVAWLREQWGAGRSCSRASPGSTTPSGPWTRA